MRPGVGPVGSKGCSIRPVTAERVAGSRKSAPAVRIHPRAWTKEESSLIESSVHERTRAERAMRLYNERGGEIRKVGPQTYLVPGCSADAYTVDLKEESCNCPDFLHRCAEEDGLLCKHLYAAVIYREKVERARRYCDYRFLELLEEDYGIRQFHLRAAFMGTPAAHKLDAIAVCERATEESADPEEAGDLVRQWARERGVGMYHPAILEAPELAYEQSAHEREVREGRR